MAKGLRIHHPMERNVILLVPVPPSNPQGGLKNIYIHLDENGDSIVSEGVWAELMRSKKAGLSAHGFVVLNEVSNPPTIVAGPGVKNQRFSRTMIERQPGTIYEHELQAIAQQFAPKGIKATITTSKLEGKE